MINPTLLAALTTPKPVAIGLGVGALVVLYLALKVGKSLIKILLVLAALAVIGLAAWAYYTAHHGTN